MGSFPLDASLSSGMGHIYSSYRIYCRSLSPCQERNRFHLTGLHSSNSEGFLVTAAFFLITVPSHFLVKIYENILKKEWSINEAVLLSLKYFLKKGHCSCSERYTSNSHTVSFLANEAGNWGRGVERRLDTRWFSSQRAARWYKFLYGGKCSFWTCFKPVCGPILWNKQNPLV